MPEHLTVTEKRISSRVREADKFACKTYDQYFPKAKADDLFWVGLVGLDAVIAKTLRRRPIGNMQIQAACKVYTRGFLELCVAGRVRDRERKASRTADPQGGEGAV